MRWSHDDRDRMHHGPPAHWSPMRPERTTERGWMRIWGFSLWPRSQIERKGRNPTRRHWPFRW